MWQRSFWFRVPLAKQIKRDKVGHREVTINNVATVPSLVIYFFIQSMKILLISAKLVKIFTMPWANILFRSQLRPTKLILRFSSKFRKIRG